MASAAPAARAPARPRGRDRVRRRRGDRRRDLPHPGRDGEVARLAVLAPRRLAGRGSVRASAARSATASSPRAFPRPAAATSTCARPGVRASRSSTAGSACSSWTPGSRRRWPPASPSTSSYLDAALGGRPKLVAIAAILRAGARQRARRAPGRGPAGLAHRPEAGAPRACSSSGASPPAAATSPTSCRSSRRGPDPAPLLPGLAGGLVAAFFSFGGFWDVAKLAGEVRDPARTLPRALAVGVAMVTLVYILTSAVFVYLVPIENVASGDAFAATAGERAVRSRRRPDLRRDRGGGRARQPGGLPDGGAARLLRDGARRRSSCPRSPCSIRASARRCARSRSRPCWPACSRASGSFDEIVAYFIFVTLCFIALTVAGLYRLPRPQGDAYRVPGYPFTPIGFLAAARRCCWCCSARAGRSRRPSASW